jgi:ankyrin repeat protein
MTDHPVDEEAEVDIDELDLYEECKYQCRSSVIMRYIDRYPESLTKADEHGCLPLHKLLKSRSSSIDDALTIIYRYPAALQHPDKDGYLPLHIECSYQARSSIMLECIELYPESLAMADEWGCLPLHRLLGNDASHVEEALTMIEKYPAALKHPDDRGELPIHAECIFQCRISVLSRCIELHPESLAIATCIGSLPLHEILYNDSSGTDAALMLIEKYPPALRHQNGRGQLPLHVACIHHCRSSIISRCIELYPEALSQEDDKNNLPLQTLLWNPFSSTMDALRMIKKYPAALLHQGDDDDLPLHMECKNRCRSAIISKCIELYPTLLSVTNRSGNLPLHLLLWNSHSTTSDALMMLEKCPDSACQMSISTYFPIRIEASKKCRYPIVRLCYELCPESLDDSAVDMIINKIKWNNFHAYASILKMVFTALPMSLYTQTFYLENDIRKNPYFRRRILHLLPRNVFTSRHDADYRDLNWQPRAAMMMLLLKMKIKIQYNC